jgi:hypothetical protein
MPEKIVKCDRCGEPAELGFGEGGFGWWPSLYCPSCGRSCEADGGPPTPDEYRQIILQQEGEWSLVSPVPATVELLKTLRAVLSLSLPETQALRNRLPGTIAQSTQYEMNQLLKAVNRHVASPGLVVRPSHAP